MAESPRRGWKNGPLAQLTLVRFREFMREPEAVFWTFLFPIVLALGLGVAFRNKPADIIAIAVERNTPAGDSLARKLAAAPGLRIVTPDAGDAAKALRTGEVALVVSVTSRGVQYRYDDTRPEARSARSLVDDAIQRIGGRKDPVAVSEAKMSEKGSRYIDFVVPGLLGMNIMGGSIWGLAFAIVEARRKGLLKRLVSTPMPRPYYLASFVLSRFTFLFAEIIVLLGSGALMFGVPIRGSLIQVVVICIIAALGFGGLGLLIASRAKTIEGVSGLANLTMMPMWVLSGVFFSSSNFPKVAQPFIQALPLTATNNALRATMLQGAGWSAVAPSLGIIAAWMVVSFVVALKLFRWR